MNTRTISVALFSCAVIVVALLLIGGKEGAVSPSLEPISLVLDWTPNTNHTGMYVALHEKWYDEEGVAVTILPYSEAVAPDVLVSSGVADVGISSTESVVASNAAGAPVTSIAAIVAHNTSSLAVRADSHISNPAQLSGKIYGGYGAPYEESVITAIIKNDGGEGDFKNVTLGVDALEALRSTRVDFVWIFDGWQGVQAKREGFELVTFHVSEYGIPDYATPNIVTSPETLANKKETLRKFMKATARGYEYARLFPRESAEMLIATVPPGTFPDPELVFESQAYLSPRYAESGSSWGVQDETSWHDYPTFMLEHGSVFDAAGNVVTQLDLNALYTNKLLP